jgi:hypothetical protein
MNKLLFILTILFTQIVIGQDNTENEPSFEEMEKQSKEMQKCNQVLECFIN